MNHPIARLCSDALVVLAGILLSGCGSSDDPTTPPGDPASLSLNYVQPTLARGQALDLRATVRDAAGNELSQVVTWSTSDSSVAAVQAGSNTATLRAGLTGTATVTATVGNLTSSSLVSVLAFASVTAGPGYSCAITTTGKLYCSGLAYGPLAVPVAPTLDFLSVTIGGIDRSSFICAIAADQSGYCWGSNGSGQLGVGDLLPRTAPTAVAGDIKFSTLSGGLERACGVALDGTPYCWGDNTDGRVGIGSTAGTVTSPAQVQMPGNAKVRQIQAGATAACAVTISDQAYCWGTNRLGQLGSSAAPAGGFGAFSAVPVPVDGGFATKQIATMGPKTCLLTNAGKAYCFGNNTVFELGAATGNPCDFDTKPCSLAPIAVDTPEVFQSLSALWFGNCGLTADRRTLCWGMDFELAFGAQVGAIPVCPAVGAAGPCTATPTPGAAGLVALSGYRGSQCGMKADGIAYCWGGNAWGQRGWGSVVANRNPGVFSIAPGT
jgi:hypothetical protein